MPFSLLLSFSSDYLCMLHEKQHSWHITCVVKRKTTILWFAVILWSVEWEKKCCTFMNVWRLFEHSEWIQPPAKAKATKKSLPLWFMPLLWSVGRGLPRLHLHCQQLYMFYIHTVVACLCSLLFFCVVWNGHLITCSVGEKQIKGTLSYVCPCMWVWMYNS